jgi:parallel beta-helix repeat protein
MVSRIKFGSLAEATVTAILAVSPLVGCGSDTKTASERTSQERLLMTKEETEECPLRDSGVVMDSGAVDSGNASDSATDASDGAVSAANCGANDQTACRVTTAFTTGSFGSVNAAIAAAPDGDIIMVRGHCAAATVNGRFGLTFAGPSPATGCGFNGPTDTQLRAEIDGLSVTNSTAISVRFLNFVNSVADGLTFSNTRASNATCNCAANNAQDGFQLDSATSAVLNQNRAQRNVDGFQVNRSNTSIVTNGTSTLNTGDGIAVSGSMGINVVANIVTNNGGNGIVFTNSNTSVALGNTIRGNGDGLVNFVSCTNSQVIGNNVNDNQCNAFPNVPIPSDSF